VDVKPARYLAVEGQDKPGEALFQAQIGALYGAAYTIKMTRRFTGRGDFKVCALADTVAALKKKGKGAETNGVRIEDLNEGRCVQMLHVGPYCEEPASIARVEAFAKENGCTLGGPHHEICLSDPRRVPPERLRTILRFPLAL
jgi:hypothetical protein